MKKWKIFTGVLGIIATTAASVSVVACTNNNTSNAQLNSQETLEDFKYKPRIVITKNITDNYNQLSIHATVAAKAKLKYLIIYQWYKINDNNLVTAKLTNYQLLKDSTLVLSSMTDHYQYNNKNLYGKAQYFCKIDAAIATSNNNLIELNEKFSKVITVFTYNNYQNLNSTSSSFSTVAGMQIAWTKLWDSYSQTKKDNIITNALYAKLSSFTTTNKVVNFNTDIGIQQTLKNINILKLNLTKTNNNEFALSYAISTSFGIPITNSNGVLSADNFFINIQNYVFKNLTATPTIFKYNNHYYAALDITATRINQTNTNQTLPFITATNNQYYLIESIIYNFLNPSQPNLNQNQYYDGNNYLITSNSLINSYDNGITYSLSSNSN